VRKYGETHYLSELPLGKWSSVSDSVQSTVIVTLKNNWCDFQELFQVFIYSISDFFITKLTCRLKERLRD